MSTNFPTSLDDTTVLENDKTNSSLREDNLKDFQNNAADAILAIEAKLGINSSAVNTSIDYLVKTAADPGHTHSLYTLKSTLTTTGDIYYASGASTPARLAVGASNTILRVTGGIPAWVSLATELGTLGTTTGDLLINTGSSTFDRLAVGSANQVLGVSGGLPAWSSQSYIDHGSLTGLADDDHTQYPELAGTETITGTWTFSGTVKDKGAFIGHDIRTYGAIVGVGNIAATTTAFADALTAAATTKLPVLVPPGSWYVTGITMATSTEIKGFGGIPGRASVSAILTTNTTGNLVTMANDCKISGLRFWRSAQATAGSTIYFPATASGSQLADVDILDPYVGIYNHGAAGTSIKHIRIDSITWTPNANSCGYLQDDLASTTIIEDVRVDGSLGAFTNGFKITACDDLHMLHIQSQSNTNGLNIDATGNCTVFHVLDGDLDQGSYGILIDNSGGGNVTEGHFQGIRVGGTTNDGIVLSRTTGAGAYVQNLTFNCGYIIDCGNVGFKHNTNVNNVTLSEFAIAGCTSDGVQLAANAGSIHIQNNRIGSTAAAPTGSDANGGWGINVIAGTGADIVIQGNAAGSTGQSYANTLGAMTFNATGANCVTFPNRLSVSGTAPTKISTNGDGTAAGVLQRLTMDNTDAVGTQAASGFVAQASTANCIFNAHGAGVTASRFGIVKAGYGEFIQSAGSGLLFGTVTATPLVIGTNNTERARFLSSGEFGIGTATPDVALSVVGAIKGTTYQRIGSATTPTNTTAGDITCVRLIVGDAALGTGVEAAVTGDGTVSGFLRVGSATAPTNTTAGDLTFVRGFASGSVLSSSASGGVGYATGAGGNVNQATNINTGVTLNTICGTITMLAAGYSVANGVAAEFTLTNSSIAATDVVVLNVKSGIAAGTSYNLTCLAVAAGSCRINLRNVSGLTDTSSAPVLSFAVIKGVAA